MPEEKYARHTPHRLRNGLGTRRACGRPAFDSHARLISDPRLHFFSARAASVAILIEQICERTIDGGDSVVLFDSSSVSLRSNQVAARSAASCARRVDRNTARPSDAATRCGLAGVASRRAPRRWSYSRGGGRARAGSRLARDGAMLAHPRPKNRQVVLVTAHRVRSRIHEAATASFETNRAKVGK